MHEPVAQWAAHLDKHGRLIDGSGWGDSSLSRIQDPPSGTFASKPPGLPKIPRGARAVDAVVRRIERHEAYRPVMHELRRYYHLRVRRYGDDIAHALSMIEGAMVALSQI